MATDFARMLHVAKTAKEPVRLIPYFPVNFTAIAKCPHQMIPAGDHRVCMVCHLSGVDRLIGKGTRTQAAIEFAARQQDAGELAKPSDS